MTDGVKCKLQKFIQAAGLDNRRNVRKLITDGKLKVNNRVIKDPNFLVDLNNDTIHLDNKRIKTKIEKKTYYIFNKPLGVISSLYDPQKRPTIKDFIGKINERIYPVGRLDFRSEGLMLLTNDGDLTNFIISPKNRVTKTYLIKIKGILTEENRKKLKTSGIFLDGKRVKPLKIDFIKKTKNNNSWLNVTIVEGKKHVIRKLFQFTGHPVEKLKRIAIGTIKLKKLPAGHWRELTEAEIHIFKKKYNIKPPEKII